MSVVSPNFAFLGVRDNLLVTLGAYAERSVFDEPERALIKIRQHAEALAMNAAAIVHIQVSPLDSQVHVIGAPFNRRIATVEMGQLVYAIRKIGNAESLRGSCSIHYRILSTELLKSLRDRASLCDPCSARSRNNGLTQSSRVIRWRRYMALAVSKIQPIPKGTCR